jgi:nicotinic acid mononucleotide adenylyltransferase
VIVGGATSVALALASQKTCAASDFGAAPTKASPHKERNAASASKKLAMVEIASATEVSVALPIGSSSGQTHKRNDQHDLIQYIFLTYFKSPSPAHLVIPLFPYLTALPTR